jgi:hypothetical protein
VDFSSAIIIIYSYIFCVKIFIKNITNKINKNMENPHLTEYSMKYYLSSILSNCHINRVNIYHIVLNLSVFILFISITGITLYYCYKRKPSAYEYQQKMLRDQEYVLNKIRFYQEQNQKATLSPITHLPMM